MNPYLVSIIFTTMAVAFMVVVLRGRDNITLRVAAVWLAAAVIAFLVPYKGVAFLGIALALTALAPGRPALRVGLYVASFLALPSYYAYEIPFPGLNYLLTINQAKLAAIILLGPIFVASVLKPAPGPLKIVDRLLLIFVLVSGVMSFRDLPLTSVIRATVDQFLLIYLPYIAISRSLKTVKDFELVLHGFLAGVVVLAAIGLISTVWGWNYYASLGSVEYKVYFAQRSGFLRIYATLTPPLLALLMGAAIVCMTYFGRVSKLPRYLLYALAPLFLFVMFVSGSRGGQLGALVTIFLYFLLPHLRTAGRTLLAVAAFIGAAGLIVYLVVGGATIYDPFGTFQYRVELLRTSVDQIARRPLFGSADFMSRPEFQALRQGEGIIDLVNDYLGTALYYGLVGLGLFVGAHFAALLRVYGALGTFDRGAHADKSTLDGMKRLCALMLAIHAGYLAMIFTTSAVSWVANYGYALLAMQVALARIIASNGAAPAALQPARANHPDPSQKTENGGVAGEEIEKPPPYGARFVRRL